jgi:hypothetical protein
MKLTVFRQTDAAFKQRRMDFPAASHGVSMNDTFYPNTASCRELNPTDFAISTTQLL